MFSFVLSRQTSQKGYESKKIQLFSIFWYNGYNNCKRVASVSKNALNRSLISYLFVRATTVRISTTTSFSCSEFLKASYATPAALKRLDLSAPENSANENLAGSSSRLQINYIK